MQKSASVYLFLAGEDFSTSTELIRGYSDALKEKGLAFDEKKIYFNAFDNYNACKIAGDIVKNTAPPYSFVCESDYVASGVVKALQDAEISIPEQARVIGVDNLSLFSFMHPQLTSVDIQIQKMGKTGVDILRDTISKKKINQKASEKRVILPVSLVERESG